MSPVNPGNQSASILANPSTQVGRLHNPEGHADWRRANPQTEEGRLHNPEAHARLLLANPATHLEEF